ncbi:MAG: MFS transporter [Steroidobacteraceae bacterium]
MRETPLPHPELDAIPTRRVGWGFIGLYALAYAGTWLALLTPIVVTLALRVQQLTPDRAAQNLSIVLAIGATCALLAGPVFGRLSDRTTSGFGMRRPWMAGGIVCGFIALAMVATATSIAAILVGWCLAQLAFNAVLASIVALLPDQVPPAQRGTVSGVLGMCMPVGQLAGTSLVHATSHSLLLSFMLPASIGLATVMLLVVSLADRRLPPGTIVAQPPLRQLLASFRVNPREHADFSWAWLSRFLFGVGSAFVNTYQPFYLIDKLGRTPAEVPLLIFQSTLVQASLIVVCSALSGKLSDLLGRRKVFVLLGALIYMVGLWTIAAAASYAMFLAGMVVIGIGYGAYFAVDLALVSEVLPDQQRDAAKDLGILNIANALPQVLAPCMGTAILFLADGSYTWLYFAASTVALASACTILPVKSVR